MLICVRLLKYAFKTFTYSVPTKLQKEIKIGILVQVPLRKHLVPAIVHSFENKDQKDSFAIKEIYSVYHIPQDVYYESFVHKISRYYQTDFLYLFARMQKFLEEKEESQDLFTPQVFALEEAESVTLTSEQQIAYEVVSGDLFKQKHRTFVLHGVTGSGKTEIYKKLIRDVLQKDKSVIVMLPEVALALRFEALFSKCFSDIVVIGFHCATTIKKKKLLWQSLLEGRPVLIIGVHLPILLPISNLGLIIVDEEHDTGYQEKKHPKIQSRDMAILKAAMYQIPIVLGSATPSIQTLWNVEHRGWKLLELKKRFSGSFPSVEVLSLKNKESRSYFWITERLRKEIKIRLDKKEQVIIFLNRRGYSFFVQCPCGYVFMCKSCSVSLTLHSDKYVMCHYCAYKELLKSHCPDCNMPHEDFLKKGIGTQQVVAVLQKLFPEAIIARADKDTTSKKRTWAQTVQDMLVGQIDILVGTQSIAKGYHFPGVTLVGILWADLNLHFPMYNAAETTLQQLIQVAGRAGRQLHNSLVLVQTFDNHEVYQYVDELRYLLFYRLEIAKRMNAGYPPYKHIAEIEVCHARAQSAETDAADIAAVLSKTIRDRKVAVDVYGPVAALVYKVKNVYVQKIVLKSFSRSDIIDTFSSISKSEIKSSVFFTMDSVA